MTRDEEQESKSKCTPTMTVVVTLVSLIFVFAVFFGVLSSYELVPAPAEVAPTDAPATDAPVTDAPATDAPVAPATDAPAPDDETVLMHWPQMIQKIDTAYKPMFNTMFTTTAGATAEDWSKSDEPCDPMLGTAWLYQGERSKKYSAAVYFTPEVGDKPGVISAIEVDFYGYLEESHIGLFFGEEKTSKDGTFRSISVALRDGGAENLCDTETPAAPGNPQHVTISPGRAEISVPLTEEGAQMAGDWQEGSCIQNMGYHYVKFLEPAKGTPYELSNMVPVVPTYSSKDGTFNGVFFWATGKKQDWPEECEINGSPLNTCAIQSGRLNMWDHSPGLVEQNKPRFYMCSNLCGTDCAFTGAEDQWSTTMHWFFRMTFLTEMPGPYAEDCGQPNPSPPFCRGESPILDMGNPTGY